jgi:hypothetical protein
VSGKWRQAENGKDEKLDIYVLVETPVATLGDAQVLSPAASPQLLDRLGKPLSPSRPPRFGFDPGRLP